MRTRAPGGPCPRYKARQEHRSAPVPGTHPARSSRVSLAARPIGSAPPVAAPRPPPGTPPRSTSSPCWPVPVDQHLGSPGARLHHPPHCLRRQHVSPPYPQPLSGPRTPKTRIQLLAESPAETGPTRPSTELGHRFPGQHGLESPPLLWRGHHDLAPPDSSGTSHLQTSTRRTYARRTAPAPAPHLSRPRHTRRHHARNRQAPMRHRRALRHPRPPRRKPTYASARDATTTPRAAPTPRHPPPPAPGHPPPPPPAPPGRSPSSSPTIAAPPPTPAAGQHAPQPPRRHPGSAAGTRPPACQTPSNATIISAPRGRHTPHHRSGPTPSPAVPRQPPRPRSSSPYDSGSPPHDRHRIRRPRHLRREQLRHRPRRQHRRRAVPLSQQPGAAPPRPARPPATPAAPGRRPPPQHPHQPPREQPAARVKQVRRPITAPRNPAGAPSSAESSAASTSRSNLATAARPTLSRAPRAGPARGAESHGQHHLEQRMTPQRPRRGQLLHQPLERHVLMSNPARPASRTRPSSSPNLGSPARSVRSTSVFTKNPTSSSSASSVRPATADPTGISVPAPSRDSSAASAACSTMNSVTPHPRQLPQPRVHRRRDLQRHRAPR